VEAPIKSFRIKKDHDGKEWLWNSKLQRTMRIWDGRRQRLNHWD
jgi:hypothetical protein